MDKKELTVVSTWSYTCKTSKGVYHSREYATREELAAIITELILRTPQRYTTVNIIRTDSWR